VVVVTLLPPPHTHTPASLCDVWDALTNYGLMKFAVTNPSLSLGEIYRDLNKKAFLAEARKLVPSLREEDVVPSFSGVMAQVLGRNGNDGKGRDEGVTAWAPVCARPRCRVCCSCLLLLGFCIARASPVACPRGGGLFAE
jgi:hypothetical protein